MPQTYDSYYKDYYANNKERINRNRREYSRKYQNDYYLKKRFQILKKREKAAKLKAKALQQTLDIKGL